MLEGAKSVPLIVHDGTESMLWAPATACFLRESGAGLCSHCRPDACAEQRRTRLNIVRKFLRTSGFFADADERADWLAYACVRQAIGFIPASVALPSKRQGLSHRTDLSPTLHAGTAGIDRSGKITPEIAISHWLSLDQAADGPHLRTEEGQLPQGGVAALSGQPRSRSDAGHTSSGR